MDKDLHLDPNHKMPRKKKKKKGDKLLDVSLRSVILSLTPRAKAIKATTNKWDSSN